MVKGCGGVRDITGSCDCGAIVRGTVVLVVIVWVVVVDVCIGVLKDGLCRVELAVLEVKCLLSVE